MGGVLEWISRSAFARDQVVTGVFSGKPDRRALEGLSVSRPAVSDILARDCYPEVGGILFRCAVRSPRFRTGADIEPAALATPDILSAYDWWRLSGIYPEGSDRWLDTLLEAAARFPDEPAFAYNAAMALMARGAWDAAAPVVRRREGRGRRGRQDTRVTARRGARQAQGVHRGSSRLGSRQGSLGDRPL